MAHDMYDQFVSVPSAQNVKHDDMELAEVVGLIESQYEVRTDPRFLQMSGKRHLRIRSTLSLGGESESKVNRSKHLAIPSTRGELTSASSPASSTRPGRQ